MPFFDNILQISLRKFFKYLFSKFLGEFFENNVKISDSLKEKFIEFKNLKLKSENVNEKLLKNFPFSLKNGQISIFRGFLPSNILEESTILEFKNIELEFLCHNKITFQNIKKISENIKKGESEKLDEFYQKLLNKIFRNLRVKFNYFKLNFCLIDNEKFENPTILLEGKSFLVEFNFIFIFFL